MKSVRENTQRAQRKRSPEGGCPGARRSGSGAAACAEWEAEAPATIAATPANPGAPADAGAPAEGSGEEAAWAYEVAAAEALGRPHAGGRQEPPPPAGQAGVVARAARAGVEREPGDARQIELGQSTPTIKCALERSRAPSACLSRR